MLIDFNLYLNHPYYKKIIDYFKNVELTDSLNWYYAFAIDDIDLTHHLLRESEFIETEKRLNVEVDARMKYLVTSIIYSMMIQKGFDYHQLFIDLDEYANNIKVSLQQFDYKRKIVKKIEKKIDEKKFVFNQEISVDSDNVKDIVVDYCYVDLFEINLDDFSFEDIDKQLEEYAKIKDQLLSELQNM